MLDTIELSKKLISFDSVTPAKQDIFDFLIETFEENGFTFVNIKHEILKDNLIEN